MEKISMTAEASERNKELFEYEMTSVRSELEEEMQRMDNINVQACEEIDDIVPNEGAVLKDVFLSVDAVDEKAINKLVTQTEINNNFHNDGIFVDEVKQPQNIQPVESRTVQFANEFTEEIKLSSNIQPVGSRTVQFANGFTEEIKLSPDIQSVESRTVSFENFITGEIKLSTTIQPVESKTVHFENALTKEIKLSSTIQHTESGTVKFENAFVGEVKLSPGIQTVEGKTIQFENDFTDEVKLLQDIQPLESKTVQLNDLTVEGVNVSIPDFDGELKKCKSIDYNYDGELSVSFVSPNMNNIMDEISSIQQIVQESVRKRNSIIEEYMNMDFPAPDISADISDIIESMHQGNSSAT